MNLFPSRVTNAADWSAEDLQSRSDWILEFTARQREELNEAYRHVAHLPLCDITRDSHPLPSLARLLADVRQEIKWGRGFVLMRGLPVEGRTAEEVAPLYWLLGRHLGEPVPQNPEGEMICHIRDTGADPRSRDTRLYTTRAEQDFHTDGADIIGLVALRGAKEGGTSLLSSSVRVYNTIAAQRPDLAPLLFEPWNWLLPNPQAGRPEIFQFPICRWDGTHLSTFFIAWYIRRAEEYPGVARLSDGQRELLSLIEQTANDPSLVLRMDFRPGDIQWLKNSVILHKRTEYVDWEEPARKRHLLRLWLAARDFQDGSDLLRGGMSDAGRGAATRLP